MTIRQHSIRSPSSIADDYCDLLAQLGEGKRQGMIRRLAVGFYDGWAPSRAELAVLVDFELGRITEEEFSRPGCRPPRWRPTALVAPTRG